MPPAPPTAASYARLALGAGVLVFLLKLAGYALTNSVAILSDALESLVNVAAAALLGFTLRLSARPADASHPYGHSKAEYLSSFVEGLLIGLAGMLIVQTSLQRLVSPTVPDADALGLGLTVVASLVNFTLGAALVRVGRREASVALEADGQHLLADVWSSAAVLLGLAVAFTTGWAWLDPVIGIGVAGGILWAGWRVLRRSLAGLMDEGLPTRQRAAVAAAIEQFRGEYVEYHDLRTRRAGKHVFVDFHLVLPGTLTLRQAHDVCDRVEDAITLALPGVSVTIHVEPENFAHGPRTPDVRL